MMTRRSSHHLPSARDCEQAQLKQEGRGRGEWSDLQIQPSCEAEVGRGGAEEEEAEWSEEEVTQHALEVTFV